MKREILFFVTLSILFLMNYANATFDATTVSGQTNRTFTVLDDTNPVINITINNTLARGTQNNYSGFIIAVPHGVNISVNGNASISTNVLNSSNGTHASYSYSNVSAAVLSCAANEGNVYRSSGQARCINWSGVHLLPGDENKKNVWFNITTYSPGKGLNISVFGYNASWGGNYTINYNITLHINDTVEIVVNGSGIVDGANLSEKAIAGFITVKGNETNSRIMLIVKNSTGLAGQNVTWGNQTDDSTVGANELIYGGSVDAPVTPFTFNISKIKGGTNAAGLPDGLYYINVSVNNSLAYDANNADENVSATFTIRIDNTVPTYTLAANGANTTQTAIGVDITITEAGAGMNKSCTVTNNNEIGRAHV